MNGGIDMKRISSAIVVICLMGFGVFPVCAANGPIDKSEIPTRFLPAQIPAPVSQEVRNDYFESVNAQINDHYDWTSIDEKVLLFMGQAPFMVDDMREAEYFVGDIGLRDVSYSFRVIVKPNQGKITGVLKDLIGSNRDFKYYVKTRDVFETPLDECYFLLDPGFPSIDEDLQYFPGRSGRNLLGWENHEFGTLYENVQNVIPIQLYEFSGGRDVLVVARVGLDPNDYTTLIVTFRLIRHHPWGYGKGISSVEYPIKTMRFTLDGYMRVRYIQSDDRGTVDPHFFPPDLQALTFLRDKK
jgi:hypothetical protein